MSIGKWQKHMKNKDAKCWVWGLILGCFISPVWANQCYGDPELAYQALAIKQTTQKAISERININTASAGELATLTGIGAKSAQAIIDYREMMGRFKTVDDLTKVKGIGEKTLEKNRHRLTVY